MHILTSLIIFFGFVLVVCLGLIQVIWDLSAMSAHASPHVLATPPGRTSGFKDEHPNANESSRPWELTDTLGLRLSARPRIRLPSTVAYN
jgi:hypothetical protein